MNQVKVEDVGALYKIRIGHDDDGVSMGWHLENVSKVDTSFTLSFNKSINVQRNSLQENNCGKRKIPFFQKYQSNHCKGHPESYLKRRNHLRRRAKNNYIYVVLLW